jgi:hypothetical protein
LARKTCQLRRRRVLLSSARGELACTSTEAGELVNYLSVRVLRAGCGYEFVADRLN